MFHLTVSTPSQTLAVSIHRAPDDVYRYLMHAENMPRWAFCKAVRKAEKDWLMVTDEGELPLRFVPENEFRIADHYVTVAPGVVVYVPMRVLANGSGGSEVIFTLFRQPTMTDADFARDKGVVEADLAKLKRILET